MCIIIKMCQLQLQSLSELLAPLVNMINKPVLFILLIFYLKKSQNSNFSLDNKNLKWGGGDIIMK